MTSTVHHLAGAGLLAFAAVLPGAAAHASHLHTLHVLCKQANCADGSYPDGGLIADGVGRLYGTTAGNNASGGGVYRVGVKFKTLYTFASCQSGCPRGSEPLRQLLLDASGDLFGVTFVGPGGTQGGTVFELTPR